jgi:hypothetical protein
VKFDRWNASCSYSCFAILLATDINECTSTAGCVHELLQFHAKLLNQIVQDARLALVEKAGLYMWTRCGEALTAENSEPPRLQMCNAAAWLRTGSA